jgi:hypothetical protein
MRKSAMEHFWNGWSCTKVKAMHYCSYGSLEMRPVSITKERKGQATKCTNDLCLLSSNCHLWNLRPGKKNFCWRHMESAHSAQAKNNAQAHGSPDKGIKTGAKNSTIGSHKSYILHQTTEPHTHAPYITRTSACPWMI